VIYSGLRLLYPGKDSQFSRNKNLVPGRGRLDIVKIFLNKERKKDTESMYCVSLCFSFAFLQQAAVCALGFG
jgi:hypothetical protein